jgi:hypothetical protein
MTVNESHPGGGPGIADVPDSPSANARLTGSKLKAADRFCTSGDLPLLDLVLKSNNGLNGVETLKTEPGCWGSRVSINRARIRCGAEKVTLRAIFRDPRTAVCRHN